MDPPPLEIGSPTASALHHLWNGRGDLHVPTGAPEESDEVTAALAAHIALRSAMQVRIWTYRVAAVTAELEKWMHPGEFGVTSATGVKVVVDVPPRDHHPHDATVLVHAAMASPVSSSKAAVDVGGTGRTIRLLPGAGLGGEPLDIAIAGALGHG